MKYAAYLRSEIIAHIFRRPCLSSRTSYAWAENHYRIDKLVDSRVLRQRQSSFNEHWTLNDLNLIICKTFQQNEVERVRCNCDCIRQWASESPQRIHWKNENGNIDKLKAVASQRNFVLHFTNFALLLPQPATVEMRLHELVTVYRLFRSSAHSSHYKTFSYAKCSNLIFTPPVVFLRLFYLSTFSLAMSASRFCFCWMQQPPQPVQYNDDWMSSRKRMQSSWLSQRALTYSFTCQRALTRSRCTIIVIVIIIIIVVDVFVCDSIVCASIEHGHLQCWPSCSCRQFLCLNISIRYHWHTTTGFVSCFLVVADVWAVRWAPISSSSSSASSSSSLHRKKCISRRAHNTLKYRTLARGNKRRFSNPKTED